MDKSLVMTTCPSRWRRSGAAFCNQWRSDGRVISRDMSLTAQSPQTGRVFETFLYRLLCDNVNTTVAPRRVRDTDLTALLLQSRSRIYSACAAPACTDGGRARQGRRGAGIAFPPEANVDGQGPKAARSWHRRCCNENADCIEDHFHHVVQTRGSGHRCRNMSWRPCRSRAGRRRSSASRHARPGPDPGSDCRPDSRS